MFLFYFIIIYYLSIDLYAVKVNLQQESTERSIVPMMDYKDQNGLSFLITQNQKKSLLETIKKGFLTRTLQERLQSKGMLIGKEVWIRRLFPQDVTGLIPLYCDPNKMKFFGFGRTYDAPWVYKSTMERTMIQKQYPDHVQEIFSLLEHEMLTRYTWSFFNHRGWSGTVQFLCDPDEDCLEIAYIGQGGTSEAVRLLLECIPPIHVRASVHPENIASIHVLKKNGFNRIEENVEKYGSVRDIYQRSSQVEPSLPAKEMV